MLPYLGTRQVLLTVQRLKTSSRQVAIEKVEKKRRRKSVVCCHLLVPVLVLVLVLIFWISFWFCRIHCIIHHGYERLGF
jgi:hypothetical protein